MDIGVKEKAGIKMTPGIFCLERQSNDIFCAEETVSGNNLSLQWPPVDQYM